MDHSLRESLLKGAELLDEQILRSPPGRFEDVEGRLRRGVGGNPGVRNAPLEDQEDAVRDVVVVTFDADAERRHDRMALARGDDPAGHPRLGRSLLVDVLPTLWRQIHQRQQGQALHAELPGPFHTGVGEAFDRLVLPRSVGRRDEAAPVVDDAAPVGTLIALTGREDRSPNRCRIDAAAA